MLNRAVLTGLFLLTAVAGTLVTRPAQAAPPGQPTNWERFYHYPYVYYPHNFQQFPESYDHLYYRYPVQKRIPVYNADWHNFYPGKHPYHRGHHFMLDVF
jgi:hypothetical protein